VTRLRAQALLLASTLALTPLAASAQAAPPAGYAQRWAGLCANCHGVEGVSSTPDTPSLAGMGSFYAATQLFLFRAGRRQNAAMTVVGKSLTDDDLRGFSDLIGQLPAPPAPTGTPDAARMAQGRAIAQRHQCAGCHGADFAGGDQVPRLAGQREEYLKRALLEFKSAQRIGYTNSMNEALSTVEPTELETLAYFLANVR